MECGWFIVVTLSLAFPKGPNEKAKHADLSEPIGRLLDFSAEPSAKSLQALEHNHRALPATIRNKPPVKYAYAVALIRQRRYQEASRVLHELVDERPDDAAAWRAKIWVELELDERIRAVTDLEQLSSHAKAHQESGAERLPDKESAEFFGAVCGYLAGPWSHKVREDVAKTIEDRLRAAFDDDSQSAFDAARAKVVESYEKFYQEHEERVQSEQAAKAKELDDAKQVVDRKAQELGQKQQAIKDKHDKRDADAKANIGDIEAQLKKIDQQRQVLLYQMAPLEAERAAMVAQMVPHMMSPFVVRRASGFHSTNLRMRRLLAPLVAKLTLMEGQVASLNRQELELRGQGFMTEFKHQTDLGKLAQQEQALDNDRKRVRYDAQRLQAKSAGSSPRLRAEADHLMRFAVYAPFPFESEKERLLAESD